MWYLIVAFIMFVYSVVITTVRRTPNKSELPNKMWFILLMSVIAAIIWPFALVYIIYVSIESYKAEKKLIDLLSKSYTLTEEQANKILEELNV